MDSRRILALLLLAAGVTWSALFPKKSSFDPDMVASVALGAGLIGTGAIVWYADRLRRSTALLSALLLWSLGANAYLFAWQHHVSKLLMLQMEATTRQAHLDAQDR